jgi:hypothetical protein
MDEAWMVPDVFLLTDGADGPAAIPHLALTFMRQGLELHKADGEPVWNSAWADLSEMSPVDRSVLPDGRDGVVMLVVERAERRRHRFVLASSNAVSTEASIRGLARAHGLQTNATRRPVLRSLNVLIAVAAVVVMTLLLLQAAHAIHL